MFETGVTGWYDESTETTVSRFFSESEYDDEGSSVHVDATISYRGKVLRTVPSTVQVSVVRFVYSAASSNWSAATRLRMLADRKPIALQRGPKDERYASVGRKLGIEEWVIAGTTPRALALFAASSRSEIEVGSHTIVLSPQAQRALRDWLEAQRPEK